MTTWYALPERPAHLPDWFDIRGGTGVHKAVTTRCGHSIRKMRHVDRPQAHCRVCVASAMASGLLAEVPS